MTAIRISHKVCGGLAGWWKERPSFGDTTTSPKYISPSMLPLEPGQDVNCARCGVRIDVNDMDWPKDVERSYTVYEQVMRQMNS